MKSNSPIDAPPGLGMHALAVAGVIAVVCLAAPAAAQTAPVHGTATPAEYECSGLEGVALSNCTNLNAAAAQSAVTKPDGPSNESHDCADMTGASLSTCMELNGQRVQAPPSGASSGNMYPLWEGQGSSTGSNVGAQGTAVPNSNTNGTPLSGGSGNTDNSSGNNPTSLSGGSGTSTGSGGSNPTSLSGGSGTTQPSSGSAPPGMSPGSGQTGSSNGAGSGVAGARGSAK